MANLFYQCVYADVKTLTKAVFKKGKKEKERWKKGKSILFIYFYFFQAIILPTLQNN